MLLAGAFSFLSLTESELAQGRWLKTLNSSGDCHLYVHTASHEIRGSRPAEFEEAGGDRDLSRSQADKVSPLCIKSGLKRFPLTALEHLCRGCRHSELVPLILVADKGDYESARKILRQTGPMIDTRPMALPFARLVAASFSAEVWGVIYLCG